MVQGMALLEKLTVTKQVIKFLAFNEPESSLQSKHKPATGLCPQHVQ